MSQEETRASQQSRGHFDGSIFVVPGLRHHLSRMPIRAQLAFDTVPTWLE